MASQSFALRSVPRWIVLVAALPTLLPLIFAGIIWPSFEGEFSAAGNAVTKFMFRLLHVVFLLLALVMFFDFKYSPSCAACKRPDWVFDILLHGGVVHWLLQRIHSSCFWQKCRPNLGEAGVAITKAFNCLILGLLWLLAVAAPCALFYQNIFPYQRLPQRRPGEFFQ